jgi:hypothetical protein
MKKNLLIFLFFSQTPFFASEEGLGIVDYSGYFRSRFWAFHSNNYIQNKFPAKKDVNLYYPDLFFRNRLNIDVNEKIRLVTFLDFGSYYGSEGLALGDRTNYIKLSQLYGRFESIKNIFISIGMQPFALPDGVILATDGSGVKVETLLLDSAILLKSGLVFAYDESTTSYSDKSDSYPGSVSREDIGFISSQLNLQNTFNLDMEVYYLVEADNRTDGTDSDPFVNDGKKAKLNWFGGVLKYYYQNFLIETHAIYNKGRVSDFVMINNNTTENKYDIEGYFTSGGISYSGLSFSVQFVAEYWSGDPLDENGGSSFQVIQPSSTFSALTMDSSGGVGFRSGSKSGHGLNMAKLKFTYLFDFLLETQLTYAIIQSNKTLVYNGVSSSLIGHSVDLYLSQEMPSKSRLFSQLSALLPMNAYRSFSNNGTLGPVFETMIGVQVDF